MLENTGCGGRVIGKMVAEKLGYEVYDTNLIELIAKESGLSKQTVSKNEGLDSALLYEMIMQDYSVPLNKSISSQDMLFVASAKVFRILQANIIVLLSGVVLITF